MGSLGGGDAGHEYWTAHSRRGRALSRAFSILHHPSFTWVNVAFNRGALRQTRGAARVNILFDSVARTARNVVR